MRYRPTLNQWLNEKCRPTQFGDKKHMPNGKTNYKSQQQAKVLRDLGR